MKERMKSAYKQGATDMKLSDEVNEAREILAEAQPFLNDLPTPTSDSFCMAELGNEEDDDQFPPERARGRTRLASAVHIKDLREQQELEEKKNQLKDAIRRRRLTEIELMSMRNVPQLQDHARSIGMHPEHVEAVRPEVLVEDIIEHAKRHEVDLVNEPSLDKGWVCHISQLLAYLVQALLVLSCVGIYTFG